MSNYLLNLPLIRNDWYDAFYLCDIDRLDYYETDWFISTNGLKVLSKQQQLKQLKQKKLRDEPLKRPKRTEYGLQIRELNNLAVCSGLAKVRFEDDEKEIAFCENWIVLSNCWKLQFVSFEFTANELMNRRSRDYSLLT